MKRVDGLGGNAFAKVASQILAELLEMPDNSLNPGEKGMILLIAKDYRGGEFLSTWKIGEIVDSGLAYTLLLECGKRLLNNPNHLSSRISTDRDSPLPNWAVAIRIKMGSKKRIVCAFGLSEDANEAVLILAAICKGYLSPEDGLKMVKESQNALLLRLMQKLLRP